MLFNTIFYYEFRSGKQLASIFEVILKIHKGGESMRKVLSVILGTMAIMGLLLLGCQKTEAPKEKAAKEEATGYGEETGGYGEVGGYGEAGGYGETGGYGE